jgi:hypothetical protein
MTADMDATSPPDKGRSADSREWDTDIHSYEYFEYLAYAMEGLLYLSASYTEEQMQLLVGAFFRLMDIARPDERRAPTLLDAYVGDAILDPLIEASDGADVPFETFREAIEAEIARNLSGVAADDF